MIIRELVLLGVIDAERPLETHVSTAVVETSVEAVALTTCSTVPVGKPAVDALVNSVPVASGKFSVRSVLLLGLAMVNVPVPRAEPDSATFDNLFLLAEFDAFAAKSVAFRLQSIKAKHHVMPVVVPAFAFCNCAKFLFVFIRHWR